MGFFDKKVTCIQCQRETGLNRYKTADGWICPECFKLCGYTMTTLIRKKTITDIQEDMEKMAIQREELSTFNPTKKVGAYIEFDEEKRQWLIPDGFFGGKKNPRIYSYDDIVEYELLEDGDTVTKGGLGRAAAGGLLLGGVGAIVGGVTGKRKTKSVINSLKIKMTINDFQHPTVYINLLTSKTKASSFIYKTAYRSAQEILSTFALIQQQNDEEQNISYTVTSPADEIIKYKSMLDNGIITNEEFEAKKKQLLNL